MRAVDIARYGTFGGVIGRAADRERPGPAAHGGYGAALVVALEEKRMNSFVLWIVATSVAQALASFAVGYGAAALIIGRQNRNRRAHLRNRLR